MAKGIAGVFAVIGINLVLSIVTLSTGFPFIALFIGAVQLVYVVPVCIVQWNKNRQFAQGIIIGAALVFLLNSLCWGLLYGLM